MRNSNAFDNVTAMGNVLGEMAAESQINYVRMALVWRRATPNPLRLLLGYGLTEG
jgi:hypothetical protein